MNNNYLHIDGSHWSYDDGVFSGVAPDIDADEVSVFCLKQAEKTRNSKWRNYVRLSQEQREELARRWEAAKDLPDGEYDYYFNLEDKNKVFRQSVEELAKKLGISYELKLKNNEQD